MVLLLSFLTILSDAVTSISTMAQCVEGTSLNVDVVITSRAGRSNNWLNPSLLCLLKSKTPYNADALWYCDTR